jgi:hypothetical protein
MNYPHVDLESLWKLRAIIFELEGIILNVILFVQLCRKHIK